MAYLSIICSIVFCVGPFSFYDAGIFTNLEPYEKNHLTIWIHFIHMNLYKSIYPYKFLDRNMTGHKKTHTLGFLFELICIWYEW